MRTWASRCFREHQALVIGILNIDVDLRILCTISLLYLSVEVFSQPVLNYNSFQLVNSPYDEQAPVISPEGDMLFFTRSNHPENMDGKRDPGDIWFSMLIEGIWSAPVHGGSVLNDRAYNAVAGFSADGKQMILIGHYADGTTAKTQGISISKKTEAGWSRPENIYIPFFLNKSTLQSGSLSNDGNTFVYSAETYGTLGVEDIYVSRKGPDGKWSEPRNLGRAINTRFQEVSPSFSADGMTLYFSSNGRKGSGSFDVYYSTRLDDTFLNWSEPVNLGTSVNSEGRELFFHTYHAYNFSIFTSTKNSDGYGDIKFYVPDKPISDTVVIVLNSEPDTVIRFKENTYEPGNDIVIYGKVTNANSGEAVNAHIRFTGDTLVVVDSPPAGFSIQVPSTASLTIEVQAEGFINSMEKLDLNTIQLKELEMNFKLQPIAVGTTVTLKNVLFIQSQPELLPESYPELDQVVAFMKANPHIEIELAGHTDNRGTFRALMSLSQKRVNRVKSYLVSKGIEPNRISGKGHGGSKPIASNDTEETRALNRRVEFTIKKL